MKKHCLHYDGRKFLMEKTCNADVDISKKLNGDLHGSIKRIPCINENSAEFECEHRCFRTDSEHLEHIEQKERDLAKFIDDLKVTSPLIERLKIENPGGGSGAEKCPICSGILHWRVSDYNGHIAMQCETDNCFSMIE